MQTNPSSTVDVTSEVTRRVNESVREARQKVTPSRLAALNKLQKKLDELGQRGLLKRQEYLAATKADFQRLFWKYESSADCP
jgi:hypothetical protein